MHENDHKKFVFYIFEKCEAVDPCARLNAARSLLYLVQGKSTKIIKFVGCERSQLKAWDKKKKTLNFSEAKRRND